MTDSVHTWARRIARATPAGRDRVVDGLRAAAMVGVVGGHWMVTGLALTHENALRQASPLSSMPFLAPATWVLQTLGLFFFVSGYAATRSMASASGRGTTAGAWLAGRVTRLAKPVAVFLGVWSTAWITLELSRIPDQTLHTIRNLVLSPLWFLGVLLVLTALTPAAVTTCSRAGVRAVLGPLAVVAIVDALRFVLWPALPDAISMVNVLAGWAVPYLFGVVLAQGGLRWRGTGPLLSLTGAGAGLLLIGVAGYPASLVGVPGAGRSNLDPPSLLSVALAVTQIGLALTLWKPLNRLLRRPIWWAVAVVLNLSAITVFLWHQTALLVVVAVGHTLAGAPRGLLDVPTGLAWVLYRLGWLPIFFLVLALLWSVFRRAERTAASVRSPAAEQPEQLRRSGVPPWSYHGSSSAG